MNYYVLFPSKSLPVFLRIIFNLYIRDWSSMGPRYLFMCDVFSLFDWVPVANLCTSFVFVFDIIKVTFSYSLFIYYLFIYYLFIFTYYLLLLLLLLLLLFACEEIEWVIVSL